MESLEKAVQKMEVMIDDFRKTAIESVMGLKDDLVSVQIESAN